MANRTATREGDTRLSYAAFTYRVLITVGIVATVVLLFLFFWFVVDVLLLVFAGVLLAVFLRSLSDWLAKHTPLSGGWALAVVVLALAGLIGLGAWLLVPHVVTQAEQIVQHLPRSIEQLRQRLQQYEWGQQILTRLPNPQQLMSAVTDTFSHLAGIFSTVLSALTSLVLILVVGLYFAAKPRVYTNGIVQLVPIPKRDRACEVLNTLNHTLRWWLVGRISSMAIIGVLTTLGLWLLGMPFALTLGLLAGLLEYIPNIGPILSAIPALLIALTQSTTMALYVLGLYVAIQLIESYVITPLVLREAVSLPPALTIVVVVMAGILFGFLGLLLATPIATVVMVLVKMLYIQDVLGGTDDQPSD
jgi:predicted PurR-regulated permease PerM